VRFTDGICEKCLERFRSEHRNYLERRSEPTSLTVGPTSTRAR
jgi:hypothetical protein